MESNNTWVNEVKKQVEKLKKKKQTKKQDKPYENSNKRERT